MVSNRLDQESARSASCPRDLEELLKEYFSSIVSGNNNTTPTESPTAPNDCILSSDKMQSSGEVGLDSFS